MNPVNKTHISTSIRRHVAVSVTSAVVVLALALTGFGSPRLVVIVSLALACAIGIFAMHLYRERRTVQAVIAFTVFFIAMMVWLIAAAVDDLPHGAEIVRYDTTSFEAGKEGAH